MLASTSFAGYLFSSVLALVVGGISGYFYVRGRGAATASTLADSAVSSLTGELAASNSRIDRLEADKRHLEELSAQKDLLIEQHSEQIKNLSDQLKNLGQLVTARDLVTDLAAMSKAGFVALGVAPDKLLVR